MMTILSPLQSALQWVWPQPLDVPPTDRQLLARIHENAAALRSLSNLQLRARADQAHATSADRVRGAEAGDMAAVFALVQEAVRRCTGCRLYDVQLLAGMAMARGAIAEMQTGEGKTLAASLPACCHALAGRSVHVVAPNSYLAGRDYELLAPAYRLLGLSVGLLEERVDGAVKRAAYACDVVYGTGYEFGFDYLRDQVAALGGASRELGARHRQLLQGRAPGEATTLQRGRRAAIIDEIDSVLIDEACLPLVLSTSPRTLATRAGAYVEAMNSARPLELGRDYLCDEAQRRIQLTQAGLERIHQSSPAGRQTPLERPWNNYVEQALYAMRLLERDVDYVVRDDQIWLVDQFTGRMFCDRSWRDGLHQAVQAKEGLPIHAEDRVAARISRQRYFRLYDTICGMTGTAVGSEHEFWRQYRLPTVVIPPARPSRRTTLPTRYFATSAAKWEAIERDIAAHIGAGRPILVGTITIDNSQLLAERLAAAGLPFRLLNGKQDESEAAIVARAGDPKTVTIATNMAGRGTDIKLAAGVAEIGGLHVIGAERHEAPRIDRQLIGRAGRQGDPGSGQFFVSADDDLVRRYAPALAERMRAMPQVAGEITADLSAEIAAVQRRVEAIRQTQRRRLLAHDHWLEEVLATLAKRS